MTLSAAFGTHETWLFIGLLIASAGVVDHSGIKIPFFAFFAHDSGKRCEEAPTNMLLAMGAAAFICIFIGIYPQPLYDILPFKVRRHGWKRWHNYSSAHVITSLQLLLFAALAFVMLMKFRLYPPEIRSINLDTDVLSRRLFPRVLRGVGTMVMRVWSHSILSVKAGIHSSVQRIGQNHRPHSLLGEPWSIGESAIWAASGLAVLFVLGFMGV